MRDSRSRGSTSQALVGNNTAQRTALVSSLLPLLSRRNMAYDPFAARNYEQQQQQQHQPVYHDGADYDPYGQSVPQPHASYDSHPAPYNDEGVQPAGAMASGPAEDKEFDPFQPPPK